MTNVFHAALTLIYLLTLLFFCLLFIKTRKIIRLAAKVKAESIAASSRSDSLEAPTAIDLDVIYSEILRLQERFDSPRREDAQNIAIATSIRDSKSQELDAAPNIRLRRIK